MQIPSPTPLAPHHPAAELDRLGDEIAELSAHLDAATARLLDLIREFDARGGWNTGFRSCAAWLSWRVGLDLGAARERSGWRAPWGRCLSSQRPLPAASCPTQRFAPSPEWPHRRLERGCWGWGARARRPTSSGSCAGGGVWTGAPRRGRRSDGMRAAPCTCITTRTVWWFSEGASSRKWGRCSCKRSQPRARRSYQRARVRAKATAGSGDVSAETPPVAQQQADALALLAETALHHGLDPGIPGERYQVVVHVDAPVLADPKQPGQSVLEGGARVSAETSRRLACDASRVVMRHDEAGRLLEIGARTRTIPPALRRALHHRDQGCRFPECGLRFTQGHHLRHWAHGGPTTLSNLAMLCRRHHRAVHEEGYQVARLPDGTLQFRRPDGRPLPEMPPPAAVPSDPVKAIRARHDSQGLRVNARTACAGWLGERLNVSWAIDVLHPLAVSARPCLAETLTQSSAGVSTPAGGSSKAPS